MTEETQDTISIGWLLMAGGAVFGFAIVVGAVLALLDVPGRLVPVEAAAVLDTPTATRRPPVAGASADNDVLGRDVPMLPSRTPTIPPSPTHTLAPSEQPSTPTPTGPTSTPLPVTPIPWTAAEKNALSWLCYGEVGGMGYSAPDACLSVIATVRTRYIFPNNGFPETTVMGTIQRPGQFNVEVRTDIPVDSMLQWVNAYQNGMRGSCTGFLYFDSVPGGPSLCRINGALGQFVEFHNGW